ncbi:MAG: hypothetical protein IKJ33_05820 [Clostridia bacterium]|nr:hypothetical protein [Clostridia bacterium]
MKKLLKTFVIFLLLPVLVFVGCKDDKKELPKIDTARYFKDKITIHRNAFAETSTDSLSILTKDKPDNNLLSQYTKFEINAEPVWIYKMYIEKISFYVYCSESSETILTVNLKMTDLATEDAIWAATQENVQAESFEAQCDILPEAYKSVKCNFEINRTVIVATGSTLSIDILNSRDIYSGDAENKSTFSWLIYGLEVRGESRTYTR